MEDPRANLYHGFAELMAEPPLWSTHPGTRWPLFSAAKQLVLESQTAAQLVQTLDKVGAEPLPERKARYEKCFSSIGRPLCWFNESMALHGQLFGEVTVAVESFYQQTGMRMVTPELPDHASVELAFLAHLAQFQADNPNYRHAWRSLETRFLQEHAGKWLPSLGRAIACLDDPVYAPIGYLLASWIEENHPGIPRNMNSKELYPVLLQNKCTLCGFCSQVCPTGALTVKENQTETALWFYSSKCIGCGKCSATCTFQALSMVSAKQASQGKHIGLFVSPRIQCRLCGQPTVSKAEYNFVTSRIGQPIWLEYCNHCR